MEETKSSVRLERELAELKEVCRCTSVLLDRVKESLRHPPINPVTDAFLSLALFAMTRAGEDAEQNKPETRISEPTSEQRYRIEE
jgi:hypothetical protein